MTDITIPAEAVEAAAMHLAENRLPEYSWLDLDEEMRGMYRDDARAAIRAAINAWPGVYANGLQKGWKHYTPALILPLPPQENPDAASK